MTLSLNDVLTAPTDPDSLTAHLTALGAVPPPPPPTGIPSIAPPASPGEPYVQPKKTPAEIDRMSLIGSTNPISFATGAGTSGIPSVAPPDVASSVPSAAPPSELAPFEAPKKLSPIEQMALPKTSPGVQPGSSAFYQNELERAEAAKANPWGSAENHPGLLGKIGHIAARVGNVAGNAIIPNVMAATPGTELNTRLKEQELAKNLGEAQTRESVERERQSTEATQELQRQNLLDEMKKRAADMGESLTEDKVGNVTGWKDKNNVFHSLDAPETPQAIRDIAETTQQKLNKPTFEKLENGDVVALKTDAKGNVSSEVVAHSDPKLETEISQRTVNGKEHKILINKKTGADIKDLGEFKAETSPAQLLAKMKSDEDMVLGYDKDNKAHLMSRADAADAGLQHISKAEPGAVDKANTHNSSLNTMQTQLNAVVDASDALNQNWRQRLIISQALSHPTDTFADSTFRAAVMSGASEKTQAYVRAVIALREAGLALPKEVTGGSRVSEVQASALWASMPGAASLNKDYALEQAKKFQADIDRLRERAPEVRGVNIVEPTEGIRGATTGEKTKGGGAGGGAPKTASMDNVNAYAQKHGISVDQAKKFFTDSGYQVK